MKKNILTIIIMAIVLINTVLTAVLIFAIVPAAQRTTKLVDKVASVVDLELESPDADSNVSVADIENYDITDQMTINLKSTDGKDHYASIPTVTISMNTKHKDYKSLGEKVQTNANTIKEIITDEFQKYTKEDVLNNKDEIKEKVLTQIQDYFKSDFIINVTFGNIVLQ